MRDYKLGILNPNESREINAPGNFFRLAKADSAVEVTAHGDGDQKPMRTEVKPNGKRKPDEIYTRWQVKNISTVAQEIVVTIGIGDADESQVQLSADTRFSNLTKDGNRYFSGYIQNAISSIYSGLGAYNPAGSGVVAYVSSIRVNAFGSEIIANRIDTTNLAQLGVIRKFDNKQLFGAPANTDFVVVVANTLSVGTEVARLPTDSAGTPTAIDFKNSPIELGEGEGIIMMSSTTNNKIAGYFELFEEKA